MILNKDFFITILIIVIVATAGFFIVDQVGKNKTFEANFLPLMIALVGAVSFMLIRLYLFITQSRDKELLEITEKGKKDAEKIAQLYAQVEEVQKSKLAVLNLLENVENEKKKVEETVENTTMELKEESARLVASIGNLSIGFIMSDLEEKILMKNAALGKIFEVPDAEITMLGLRAKLIDSIDLRELHKKVTSSKVPIDITNISFGRKFLKLIIAPVIMIRRDHEEVIGYVVLVEDITGAKALEHSRDEFFAVASHELRTPLTAIRGNTEMILDMYADKIKGTEVKEMLGDINEASIRLIGIVNDFLEVSRLEQGNITLKINNFDIVELIDKVIKTEQTQAADKKIHIQFEKGTQKLPLVYSDQGKAEQILFNLIGNAIKFTNVGDIKVSVENLGKMLKIKVSDTGAGISLQNEYLLFKKFQFAGEDILTSDITKSTGLGLYISKLLIEKMGGTIGLEKSEIGKGSVFFFTLPIVS